MKGRQRFLKGSKKLINYIIVILILRVYFLGKGVGCICILKVKKVYIRPTK